MKMRKFAALFLAISLMLGSSLALAQDKETIKLGFGGALLGDVASYGNSGFYGMEYTVLQANAKGGVLGKQIEIIKEDDSCKPDMASNAATKLMSAGITVAIGHTCSGATKSALSAYGNNVLLISPSATEVSLTESGDYPYFFRTTPRDDAQSRLQVALLKQKGLKKVAILHDKGDYGKGLAELAKNMIEADPQGIEIVMFEGVTTGEVDYTSVIANIKKNGAEAIIWGGYYPEASKIAVQMKKRKVDAVIIGADGLYDDSFIKLGGAAAEGSFAAGQADLSASPKAQAAIADHKKRHTEEYGTYFLYAASATQALLSAIEKTGNTTDLATIKKYLQEDMIDTPMGQIKFDAKGDVIGAGYKMYEVKNGQFVEIAL